MGKLIAASLFSGCGAMDLGIEGGFDYLGKRYQRHPIKVTCATDIDRYAGEIYDANFDHKCSIGDVKDLQSEALPPHHILLGGFPCQSFSIVAQNPPRLGYDDNSSGRLVLDMCRIARERKPMCVVGENVKGLLSANEGRAFPLIIKAFEEAGYHVTYKVLDASDFGVPQRRERVFIIGFRDPRILENFVFPVPTTRDQKVPLGAVLDDENEIEEKYWFSEKAVQGMAKVREKMNKGRVQDPGEPCNTVSAHLAKVSLNSVDPVLCINGRYRRFTPREVARIQAFPESFALTGSDTRLYRAIGNAVPPVLMWHVAREIVRAITRTDSKLLSVKPFRTNQEIRSYNMSRIRSKHTVPELTLRRALWEKGRRYRIHPKDVFGKPDIVFKRQRVAVFCDSGFWHGRNSDATVSRINTNKEYWANKLHKNVERDTLVTQTLEAEGWRVLRIWDDEIKHDVKKCVDRIEEVLTQS